MSKSDPLYRATGVSEPGTGRFSLDFDFSRTSFGRALRALTLGSSLALPLVGCDQSAPDDAPHREVSSSANTARTKSTVGTLEHILSAPGWINTTSAPTVESLKGHVVVVYFWGTDCIPCRQSIPYYNDLQSQKGSEGLTVLALTSDSDSRVTSFQNSRTSDKAFRTIIGVDAKEITTQLNIRAVPSVMIFGRDGHLEMPLTVAPSKDRILAAVDSALHRSLSGKFELVRIELGAHSASANNQPGKNPSVENNPYSSDRLLDLVADRKFAKMSGTQKFEAIIPYFEKNLPNATESGDVPACMEAQMQVLKLIAGASPELKAVIREKYWEWLRTDKLPPVLRQNLAISFGTVSRHAMDRAEWPKYGAVISQFAPRESDPRARAELEELGLTLEGKFPKNSSPPSRLDTLRDTEGELFEKYRPFQREIHQDLSANGLTPELLSKLRTFSAPIASTSLPASDDTLIRAGILLELAYDLAAHPTGEIKIRAELRNDLLALYLSPMIQADEFAQYLFLMRLADFGVRGLSEGKIARLEAALLSAKQERDLFRVARTVELLLIQDRSAAPAAPK